MSTRTCHPRGLLATIAISFCFHAQAAPRTMTLEQAIEKGTSLKGCPERDIGLIESVYASDSEGDPKGVRPGKPIYLVFQAVGATDNRTKGPASFRFVKGSDGRALVR